MDQHVRSPGGLTLTHTVPYPFSGDLHFSFCLGFVSGQTISNRCGCSAGFWLRRSLGSMSEPGLFTDALPPAEVSTMSMREALDDLKSERSERLPKGRTTLLVLLLTATSLAVLPLVDLDPRFPKASRGLAVLLVTALFWVTEVMPLAVSSMLPMALYPLFGIVHASTLAHMFFSGVSFLFIAGFFLGLAIERWNLHTRFVHFMLSKVGGRVEFYLAAFMLTTWLLSMWISNTAAMLCIAPMVKSFQESVDSRHVRFQGAMLLAIGYSATIGGLATPVGTPTNGIFMALFREFWPDEEEFSFATFCITALPLSALLLVVCYLMACTVCVWTNSENIVVDAAAFFQKEQIGPVSVEEVIVLVDMLCLMLLWFTASRIDRFPGWKHAWGLTELNSGSIGLLLTLPLFVIPCGRWLPAGCKRLVGEERCRSICKGEAPGYILDWQSVKQDFSWEILFVFGGGALIAHGTVKCGLAELVAEQLQGLGLSEYWFILIVLTVVAFVTEVVSNMSTLNIFGAMIASAGHHMGFNPVQLLLGVSFAASFAFMLPMAGGPNMVVYSSGKVSVKQMASFGLGLNLVAILLGSVYITFVLPALLQWAGSSYDDLPLPSKQGN